MKRFIHMEDNEDGTMTLTMCVDEKNEQMFLIQMSIDDVANSTVNNQAMLDMAADVADNFIEIPNEI